jgi:ribose-phosphate pyrophosphokinase
MSAKRVESHSLAGEVEGEDVVLIDNMISTGQTLVTAADVCKSYGAKKIRTVATHGLFVNGGFDHRAIEKMIVADTTALRLKSKKIKVVSVAPLFTQAIHESI